MTDNNNFKDNNNVKGNWYVVKTYSQYEKKVKENFLQKIKSLNLENKIFQVVVPYEEIVKIKNKKKTVIQKPFFPGYVFINMILDQETYWFVKNTQGVSGFLGGHIPVPLQEEEKKQLLDALQKPVESKPAISFEKNESVRIIEGPFRHFIGVVEEINEERGKIKVMVTVFSRQTPVELDFFQVEKI